MKARIPPVPMGSQRGFTLLEALVATLILTVGMTYIWYTFRSSVQVEVKHMEKGMANELAASDLEALRVLPRHLVRDTLYEVPYTGEKIFRVARTVFDSTDMEEFLFENNLPPTAGARWMDRPLELVVKVYIGRENEIDLENLEPAATLRTLVPDYLWY